jgi:membrane protease YdiL (CAAX protease family)
MGKINTLRVIALVVVGVAAAQAFAMQPSNANSWRLWAALLAAYGVLGGLAVLAFRNNSELPRPILLPKGGDLSLGVLVGVVTVAVAFLGLQVIAGPGTGREIWLFRLYAQSGNIQGESQLTILLGLVVVLEELVWRGWVLSSLRTVSERWAAPLSALAYALAHLPVFFTLGDPVAGGNPLIPLAALGGGLVWGYMTQLTGRVLPTIIAHGVFTYFLVGPPPRLF